MSAGATRALGRGEGLETEKSAFVDSGRSCRAAATDGVEPGPVEQVGDASMRTIPHVPILKTGTYHLAGNPYQPDETTFTEDDLRDAVASQSDPAVLPPRLKLGHTSEWGDGEPAFGMVTNLQYDSADQTLYGDYTGTPAWLAEVLPVVYPNRSIEAQFNVQTATGNKFRMVITAVALLGVKLPGVATLPDLVSVFTEDVPEGVEIVEDEDPEEAAANEEDEKLKTIFAKRRAKASTNLEDIRRAFYENVAIGDQVYWWIREVFLDPEELVVDDGDGDLFRMSFSVSGEEVEFGEPESVKVQYVAAETDAGETVLKLQVPEVREGAAMAFASRAESRPESIEEEDNVKLTEDQLKRLGLPADASDEDVQAALDKTLAETPGTPDEGGEAEKTEDGDKTETEGKPEAEVEKPESVAASLPEGMVAVPAEQWERVQSGAQAGAALAETTEQSNRDRTIDAAVSDGKIPPAERKSMENLHTANREGFYKLLTASVEEGGLAKNLVPVTETGSAPAEDAVSEAEATAHRAWMTPREVAIAKGEVQLGGTGTVIKEGRA